MDKNESALIKPWLTQATNIPRATNSQVDSDDDDVPISTLREHIARSKGRPRRELKRPSKADAEPRLRRSPKKLAVAYGTAKAEAEYIAAEIKQKHKMRDSAPAAQQCAEFVLEKIQTVQGHVWFAEPVDPERDGCPDYLDIIDDPMDLATLQSNVTDGRYDTPESFFGEFVNDTRRVFDNATAYNYDTDHVFFSIFFFSFSRIS
jgi:transcription initiation factor TFIID subunit 2